MWTTEEEVVARLRKRWNAGEWLAALARDEAFEPVSVSLAAPRTADLEAAFGAVQDWSVRWRASMGFRVEYKRIGGRRIGSNEVPFRVWIDSFDQLCSLLRTRAETDRFEGLLAQAVAADLRLRTWVVRYPMRMLELQEAWPRLLEAVSWIRECADPGRFYLRQIDAAGVDTKLIESHRRTLAGLLDLVLPPERIDAEKPVTAFAARYGFKAKPDYVRFRLLDGSDLNGCTELQVRADEFRLPPHIGTVFVVENEITYLAFPDHPNAAVLLGGGYAVASRSAGLLDRRVLYWGDIDTHGFAILDRLRANIPAAESILMDEATLTSHEQHWVREPSQAKSEPRRLSESESDLYAGLLADRWGASIRLEQERVRFSYLTAILEELENR